MVRAVLPTPPSPSTTSLYSVIFPAILTDYVQLSDGVYAAEMDGGCAGNGPDRGTGAVKLLCATDPTGCVVQGPRHVVSDFVSCGLDRS